MKAIKLSTQQQGVASLAIAMMLLISITLVTLYTSTVVLNDTKMSADNIRTAEATAAATAAMNSAVASFVAGGIDRVNNISKVAGADCHVDYTVDSPLPDPSGSGKWAYYYNNDTGNACGCDQASTKACALVTAIGRSDDNPFTLKDTNADGILDTIDLTAENNGSQRTITQCLTMEPLFSDDGKGPAQPFFSKASVGIGGNARIINRYTNSSIWTGGANDINGASFGTYLRPSTETVASLQAKAVAAGLNKNAYLNSNDSGVEAQKVSSRESGMGIDVITDDPTLGNKTPDEVFAMFFGNKSKDTVKGMADDAGQMYSNSTDPLNKTGLVWVDGDFSMNHGDVVGSPSKPVVLIIKGNAKITGGTVYGAVYTIGELTITGNPNVQGSLISESGTTNGAGTVDLVYVPFGGDACTDKSLNDIIGTMGVVAGSWKDW